MRITDYNNAYQNNNGVYIRAFITDEIEIRFSNYGYKSHYYLTASLENSLFILKRGYNNSEIFYRQLTRYFEI